jgi:hypothetical protein
MPMVIITTSVVLVNLIVYHLSSRLLVIGFQLTCHALMPDGSFVLN